MTLLEDRSTEARDDSPTADAEPTTEHHPVEHREVEHPEVDHDVDHHGPIRTADGRLIDPEGRIAFRGMRIRRVRLKSVAKISLVFWLLAFVIIVATIVAIWNIGQSFGYIDSFEETITTSLGLETFEIDGGGIFGVIATAVGVMCLLGWLGTLAMAAVYNAACGVLGGLALETGPLQRRHRVFSLRHRGFVTVSE